MTIRVYLSILHLQITKSHHFAVAAPPPSRPYYKVSSLKFLLLFSKSVFGNDSCLFVNFASLDPNESCFATLLQHHRHLHLTHLIKSETRFTWGVFPLIQREGLPAGNSGRKKEGTVKREEL